MEYKQLNVLDSFTHIPLAQSTHIGTRQRAGLIFLMPGIREWDVGILAKPEIESELTHKLAANCMLMLGGRWGNTSLLSHTGKRKVEGKKGLATTPIE